MIGLRWLNAFFGGLVVCLWCPCCFVQIILNLFGIGCAGLNNFLHPYRPLFLGLTVISLSYSYIRYRPSKMQFLFIIIVASLLSFSPEILNRNRPLNSSIARNESDSITTHWQIKGLHCESCRQAASRAIEAIDGVIHVNVDLKSGQADVVSRTSIDEQLIIDAVEKADFQIFKITTDPDLQHELH